jgi:hypothetical protein
MDAEFNTQYINDKMDATSDTGSAGNTTKRARKQYMLLKQANTLMRDEILEVVKDKTILSHLKNKDYVQTEIDNFNDFPATHTTRIIPLTCVQLIIDIFTVMTKRGGSGKVSLQALCTQTDPSSASFVALHKQLLDAKVHLMLLRPVNEQVAEIMMLMQLHAF